MDWSKLRLRGGDRMGFKPSIEIGETVNADRIYKEFNCQRYKGIMSSVSKNALVLVSDRIKSIYHDRWDGDDILYYTGTGRIGNQVLDSANGNNNNKIATSRTSGISMYLFEKFVDKEYVYRGQVKLVKDYYTEKQLDDNGDIRDVYIFPLQLIDNLGINENVLAENNKILAKKAQKRTEEELLKIVNGKKGKIASVRKTNTTVFERDEDVAEFVKRRAKGLCELCGNPAPFTSKHGAPFLEAHHVNWLSQGGSDSIENAVALCPNCHRKMHILNEKKDTVALLNRLQAYSKKINTISAKEDL